MALKEGASPLCLRVSIHRSAWKVDSRKFPIPRSYAAGTLRAFSILLRLLGVFAKVPHSRTRAEASKRGE